MNLQRLKEKFQLNSHNQYLLVLFSLLSIKLIWALFEIQRGYISLNPDEAQYWTWSRYLDFGFYSKPPGIAWQIWLGCKLFGNTELGVRSFSALISMLSSLAIYYLAVKSNFKPKLCFWAAIIFAFSPIGMMGTFAATTDGGFILFWTLALYPLIDALEKKETPNYFLTSLFILCGALYKWPIYLLWAPVLISCFFYRPFYNKGLFNAMALSLAGLLPSVIWNSQHNWVTFKHTFTQTTTTASKGNFFDFFGAQFGVLSPIFFILLLLGLLEILRRRKELKASLLFSAFTTAFILCSFIGLSFFKKIQANWCLYAYPSSTLVISWYAHEILKKGSKWLWRGLALSFILVFFFVAVPFIQTKGFFSAKILPYSINPFRHSLGWSNLKKELDQIEYNEEDHFLFSDSYQLTSLLSFYGPVMKRQYFFNTNQRRQNQFCFWPSMAEEKLGKTGYYIWAKNSKNFLLDVDPEVGIVTDKLNPYFKTVELVKVVPLFTAYGKVVKGALIFKCEGYNGKEPAASKNY